MKKAQMFVVTAIFLATMLFTVQQAFITYAKIDLAEPFDTTQNYIFKGIIRTVNESISNAPESGTPLEQCRRFQKNIEIMLDEIKFDVSKDGYLMETNFEIDCANWNNIYPNPAPLSLNIRLSETYDYNGRFEFYHNE